MNHELYIKRCLQIAKNAIGISRPNPAVGAVIVYNDIIIGEGFTSVYGENHAEVNAVNSVKDTAILKESTIYVTLEPCSHFGKTPPCADLLVKHQFKKVVIGCVDSNSLVAGKGIERLKNAEIEVIVGVLEKECREHHKRFFTVQEKKRPYIILKWAQTKNGFIAPENKNSQKPVWISNSYSRQLVHKFRAQEQAILVGTNTVLDDNPTLNLRDWFGNHPVRIVIDKDLKIPKNLSVHDQSVKTIFITDVKNAFTNSSENIFFEGIDFNDKIATQICNVLQKHQIQSVIIEGGTITLQTFIDENLWDEARVFESNFTFENGTKAPIFVGKMILENEVKNDTLKIYTND
ncbi:MAG: bifunctional diaminohydroxyphosphoribosylaminopyrimidine deaminase/5-amino-6-(5-phosphoribosylamino)uracil reductase RibD [Polaribacter sp.]|nr:bifunctional diaminohydroxyphosphoribosylaminopyrimidine deaminase/5-amino-6-(5-phosphoribosylamino)uracil reductase RibD [Polaribacter sp.]